MRLSLEIPTKVINDFSPLCDLDFALAHLVLKDETYADFYAAQAAGGRQVILDNGFHEIGEPLSVPEILKAADRIKPTFVIAPDWLGKPKETYDAFRTMVTENQGKHDLGVVLAGRSAAERSSFFTNVRQEARMLCLPFKEDRFRWLSELMYSSMNQTWPPYIHLLGVNELRELDQFHTLFYDYGVFEARVSVDTSKPIKLALKSTRMPAQMRGLGPLNHDLKEMTLPQRQTALYNIAYLRKHL